MATSPSSSPPFESVTLGEPPPSSVEPLPWRPPSVVLGLEDGPVAFGDSGLIAAHVGDAQLDAALVLRVRDATVTGPVEYAGGGVWPAEFVCVDLEVANASPVPVAWNPRDVLRLEDDRGVAVSPSSVTRALTGTSLRPSVLGSHEVVVQRLLFQLAPGWPRSSRLVLGLPEAPCLLELDVLHVRRADDAIATASIASTGLGPG